MTDLTTVRGPGGREVGWGLALLFCLSLAVEAQEALPLNLVEEDTPEEYSLAGRWQGMVPWPAGGQARVFFDYRDAQNHRLVEISDRQVRIVAVVAGRRYALAEGTRPTPAEERVPFTLQRRRWWVAVVYDRQVVATAYGDAAPGGGVGFQATPAAIQLTEVQMQPVEPLYFTDDFVRAGNGGEWRTLLGQWQAQGVASNQFDPRLSANPFVYRTATPEPALTCTGYWFWDTYHAEAAVKPEGEGVIGLAVYVEDAANQLLFRWASPRAAVPYAGQQQWVEIVRGRERVLAQADGGFMPSQWYKLAVEVGHGELRAYIDHQEVLAASSRAFGQGAVGLYAAGCPTVRFDDVLVETWEGFQDDFEGGGSRWSPLAGTWQVRGQALVGQGNPEALALTGHAGWQNLTLQVEVKAEPGQAVGLCFGHQGPQQYYLFRCRDRNRQLLRVENGTVTTLGEATGEALPAGPVRLGVEVQGGYVAGLVGGQRAVEAAVPQGIQGRVGLYTAGQGTATFDHASVHLIANEQYWPRLTEQFTKEATMEGWASARGAWFNPEANTFWHKGDFYGDSFIQVRLPHPAPATGTVRLALAAGEDNFAEGYGLILQATQGANTLQATLTRRGATVRQQPLPLPEGAGEAVLTFARRGRALLAAVEDQPGLSFVDPQPLRGTRVGFRTEGLPLLPENVRVWSSHLHDDTFSNAPTEWFAQRGTWETTERWTCSPQWSFFGGFNDPAPMLWSKRSYQGDLTIEAYVSIRMHDNGYNYRGDLNLTFCARDYDLGSGYSFIYGGWNNTTSRLYRGSQPVAENAGPEARLPLGEDTNAFHRHWWHLRVQKKGGQIRAWVDDRLILEYLDPAPLPGGQIALWTLNKGILVARTRIWYEQADAVISPRPPAPLYAAPAPPRRERPRLWSVTHPAQTVDFEDGLGGALALAPQEVAVVLDDTTAAAGKRSLKVVNLKPGGDFLMLPGFPTFDAVQLPILAFDYKIPPNVPVNIFLTVQNQRYAILFTGQAPADQTPVIGRIAPVKADNQWHHAEFDLGTALRQVLPNATTLPVEWLQWANPQPDPYARVGLGGNRVGATYFLDNLQALGPGGPTAEFRWALDRPGEELTQFKVALDTQPETNPQKQPAQPEPVAVFRNLRPGTYYFHLLACDHAGRWLDPVHYPLAVAAGAPDAGDLVARGFDDGGLQAEYFNDPPHGPFQPNQLNQPPPGPFFTQRVFTRRERTIHFNWAGNLAPSPDMSSVYWTARWTGTVNVPAEADYTFYFEGLDDGARLYLDDQLVLDAWKLQPPADHASPPVHLTAGRHKIKVEYYQGPGPGGAIHLKWSSPALEKQLMRFDPPLLGEYFDDPDQSFDLARDWGQLNQPPAGPVFTTKVLERPETEIAFSSTEKPDPRMQEEYWSVRWTGRLRVPRTEAYTFYVDHLDDAARIFIDGQLILDSWRVQADKSEASLPVQLEAGLHDVVIEYHQATGPVASCQVSWSSPSLPKEIIPPYFPVRVAGR